MSDKRTRAQAEAAVEELRPWLPASAPAYLDIGCGSGVVTEVVAATVDARAVHLVDGDGSVKDPKSFNGYGPAVAAWGDVGVAAVRLLNARPLRPTWVYVAPALPSAKQGPFDLVTSFLSWGHHYPIDAYLAEVAALLRPGGRLVVDLRQNWRAAAERPVVKLVDAGFRLLAIPRKR